MGVGSGLVDLQMRGREGASPVRGSSKFSKDPKLKAS